MKLINSFHVMFVKGVLRQAHQAHNVV